MHKPITTGKTTSQLLTTHINKGKTASLLACVFLMFGLQVCADTISDVKTTSKNYLSLPSGQHSTYSDLVTTKDDNHPDCVVIGGTIYYYKANESTPDLTLALRNLANTGSNALTEVSSSDNYIFSVNGKYYTYIANNLQTSIFNTSVGTSENYTYKTTDTSQNDSYYLVTIDANKMNTSNNISWTKSNADGVSSYTWSNATTVPLSSTPNYVETEGNLARVDGAIRFNLPYNGSSEIQYYIYRYINPYREQIATTRIENITEDISNTYFYGEGTVGNGGAIYNTYTDSYSIIADFIMNTAASDTTVHARGGAIYNSGNIVSVCGDFIGNTTSTTTKSYDVYGGAIYNDSKATIGSIVGDFIGNAANTTGDRSDAYGGAIYNSGTLGPIIGNFIGNTAKASNYTAGSVYGGAIYNSGTISSISGNFIGNIVNLDLSSGCQSAGDGYGGAIFNSGTIGSITGDFIGNTIKRNKSSGIVRGGAINGGKIGSITGDFIGNNVTNSTSSASGGAIAESTIGSITGDFIENTVSGYTGNACGGAIYNSTSTITTINGNFIKNTANSTYSTGAYGGAIYNNKTITSIAGDFIENTTSANAPANGSSAYGGAIYNSGAISSITGNFIGNTNISSVGNSIYFPCTSYGGGAAIYNSGTLSSIAGDFIRNTISTIGYYSYAYGGAIYNVGGTINSIIGDFIENTVTASGKTNKAYGGAIYNSGTITLNATEKDILFKDNTDSTGYNDLYQSNGIINLNANTGKSIIFNGSINGVNTNTININDSTKNTAVGGEYIFNNNISNNNIVLADNAKVKFGSTIQSDGTTTYGNMTSGSFTASGTNTSLDTQNNHIDTNVIGTLTFTNPITLAIDVSLSDSQADTLSATTVTAAIDSAIINNINLITDSTKDVINIKLTNHNTLRPAYKLSDDILSNITKSTGVNYDVKVIEYDNALGYLRLSKIEDVFNLGLKSDLIWENVQNSVETDYEWQNDVALNDIIYNDSGEQLIDVTGVLKQSNANGEIEYKKFTFTPSVVQIPAQRMNGNIIKDIKNVYFYEITSSENGGAIYNTQKNNYSVIGDFISNTSIDNDGGAIFNKGSLNIISGNFIGNTSVNGGAIATTKYNYKSASSAKLYGSYIYSESTTETSIITNIDSSYIGNIASSNGGAIYNEYCEISEITGDFIGNSSINGSGGAICNNAIKETVR